MREGASMLSRTACGRPGTLSVWETWKPRPGAVPLSFVPSVLVCISICMIPTGMCLQACEFTTLAGHWLWPALYRAPRYGSAARATLPARRRTSHGLQLLLVQQPPWEPRALGRRHTTRPSRTGHAEYASRRSLRSVGMVYRRGRSRRGDAPRQQQRQRDRSSGRDDVSGCSRPCLIAYYDLAFFRYNRLLSPAKASQS